MNAFLFVMNKRDVSVVRNVTLNTFINCDHKRAFKTVNDKWVVRD